MSRWFLYFFLYSLAGYGLEKLFARAIHSEHQVRKCFLLLPLCPVYGLAMSAVLAMVPASWGLPALILAGGAVCTAVEYLVHLFYDAVFSVRFWDYSLLPGHLGGRVCPQFALIWGVLSAASVRWIQPWIDALAAAVPPEAVLVLWVALAADCVLTGALLRQYRDIDLLSLRAVSAQMRASSQSSTS